MVILKKVIFKSYIVQLASILLLGATHAFAQQNIQYTQYMYDLSLINPAYTGAYEALNVTLIHRDQWTGLEGAPQAQTLSTHTLFKKKQFGTGLLFHRETIGVHQNINAAANFAYHLTVGAQKFISVGINGGVFNTQSDYQSLQPGGSDPSAYDDAFTGTEFNMGFGLFYRSPTLEIGYSVPTILAREVYINDTSSIDPSQLNHLFFSKYDFKLSNLFELSPSFLLKYYPDTPLSFDINLLATYNEFISAGLSYRKEESIDLLFRLQISPQLQIGYAFDYPIGTIQQFSRASNELMLRYLFKFKYDKVKAPR